MNDERPIEKLLRRYAKKRGDEAGPPPEMHPATRRLLQGEVTRQFPNPAAGRKSSVTDFFAVLKHRWIYGVGLLVVLGVAAAMFLPALGKSKNRELLALKKTSDEGVMREAVRPVAVPTETAATPLAQALPPLAGVNDRRDQLKPEPGGEVNNVRLRGESAAVTYSATKDLEVASRFADAKQDSDLSRKREEAKAVSLGMTLDSAAPKPTSATVPAPSRAAGETPVADSLALNRPTAAGRAGTFTDTNGLSESRQSLAPPTVATVVPAAPITSAQEGAYFARDGGFEKDAERFYSQSFANVAPGQLRAKAAKINDKNPVVPVLASFQVQQSGNELRVIDSDGSTYLGEMNATPANFAGGGGAAGKEQSATSFKNDDQLTIQSPASAVPATGQQVLNYQWRVEGTNRTLNQNVVFTWNFAETNALAVSQLPSGAAQLPVAFPAQLQNSLIYGRAQVGPGQQIEINAVPLKP